MTPPGANDGGVKNATNLMKQEEFQRAVKQDKSQQESDEEEGTLKLIQRDFPGTQSPVFRSASPDPKHCSEVSKLISCSLIEAGSSVCDITLSYYSCLASSKHGWCAQNTHFFRINRRINSRHD